MNSSNEANNREGLGMRLMWGLCRAVAALPYKVQYYGLQEAVCFVLKYIVRYRRRLIMHQLSESFPERSRAEIRSLCSKYYDTLAEWVVNTITLAGMDDAERARRITFHAPLADYQASQGRNIVALTSHYGFWEYYSFFPMWMPDHCLVGAYHEIKSRFWNDFYLKLRSHGRIVCVSSQQFMRFFLNHRDGVDGRNLILGLVADQNSTPRADSRWYRFLHRDTLFFDGGEQLALRFGMPVYYFEMERLRRGYYKCNYHMIYDGSEQVAPHEITERYVRCLEATIQRCPELWMWSHNRWKFRREEQPSGVAGKPDNEKTEI